MRGISYLGLDTLADQGGARVRHWAKKDLPRLFSGDSPGFGCARPKADTLPEAVSHNTGQPVDWVAAKNKFFVQILTPEGEAPDCTLLAERDTTSSGRLVIERVAAQVGRPGGVIAPGDTVTRRLTYYAGPKKFSVLSALGVHKKDVMELGWYGGFFGWFGALMRWICPLLLWVLNAIYGVIRNYGVAIILLTVLIKIVFWPITNKSTESMRKMQQIQPEIAELRKKHKDNPKKVQQETMLLYRKHKVNPMAGCLPMLLQIPVFIALFTVLRSAVELRFAGFLWISDLSEPEGLFSGHDGLATAPYAHDGRSSAEEDDDDHARGHAFHFLQHAFGPGPVLVRQPGALHRGAAVQAAEGSARVVMRLARRESLSFLA
jgi:membrane protein insertase Oxa1/YidC/SpoIIIJ